MNILGRMCMNLKINAYNLETDIVCCNELQFLLSSLRSRQNMNILGRVCMHAYNLELQFLLSR